MIGHLQANHWALCRTLNLQELKVIDRHVTILQLLRRAAAARSGWPSGWRRRRSPRTGCWLLLDLHHLRPGAQRHRYEWPPTWLSFTSRYEGQTPRCCQGQGAKATETQMRGHDARLEMETCTDEQCDILDLCVSHPCARVGLIACPVLPENEYPQHAHMLPRKQFKPLLLHIVTMCFLCAHTDANTPTTACMHEPIDAHKHTCTRTNTCACRCAQLQVHPAICPYRQSYMHTCSHTYIQVRTQSHMHRIPPALQCMSCALSEIPPDEAKQELYTKCSSRPPSHPKAN